MGTYERKQKKSEGRMEKYLKTKIINGIEKMDYSDIKFLNQILILVNNHLKRTGKH